MTARTTVRESSQGYGRSVEVLRHTLPDLAEPIEKYTAALREESYDNRIKVRSLEQEVAALRESVANLQKSLRFALGSRQADQ